MDILIRCRQDIHSCLGFLQCTQTCWRDNRVYPIWPGNVFCTTEGSVACKVEEMSEITFLTSCKGSDGLVDDGWVKLASEWVNFRKDKKVNGWFGFSHSHLFPLNVFINFNLKLWACFFYKQPRHLLPPLGSLIFYLNVLQWSSPKEHKHCQTLQALSAGTNPGPGIQVPDPHWVAPIGLPRSSVFSSTSLLVDWGGKDQ